MSAIDVLVAASGVAPGDRDAFARHVAALHPDGPPANLVAVDLGLAYRALAGDASAVTAIFETLVADVAPALRRMGARDHEIEELVQRLRVKALVGDGERAPRLAAYAGRGSLRRWLRTALVNAFLNLRRDEPPACDDDALLDAIAGAGDGEMELVRARYRDTLAGAIGNAIAALEPAHKLVLRYAYLDGLGLDAIGAALRVSRATAHRRVQAARDALRERVEAIIGRELGLDADELESLQRIVLDQIEVSVRRLLET
jgi:RNA polymerase sigma-70 factor (ECF subfamily)